jgi:hypothetical protein
MGANQLCLIGLQHDFSENRERRFATRFHSAQ